MRNSFSKKIKIFVRNIIVGLLLSVLIFGSFGFSISKVSCSVGEMYILGEEIPECNKKSEFCCKPIKEKKHHQNSENEGRKKKTTHFKIDLKEYMGNSYQQFPNPLIEIVVLRYDKFSALFNKKIKYHSNPPPLLSNPKLALLQTFLI